MERNLSLDYLKLILSFLVVGIHGYFLYDINHYLSYIFVQGVARISVPLFLIISGYFFFKITSILQFKKLLKRLFILYIIWFLIYTYKWYYPGISLSKVIFNFFSGPWHLWYLIESIYAFIILWFLIKKKYSHQVIFVVLCSIIGITLQYIYNYFSGIHLFEIGKFYLYRNFLFYCLPFIFIGYSIHKYSYLINLSRNVLLFIIGIILLLFESSINYYFSGNRFDILLSSYIVCPSLFTLISSMKYRSNSNRIAEYSTGVYLVHLIILSLPFKEYFGIGDTSNVFITCCLSLIISFFLIRLNRIVKYLL